MLAGNLNSGLSYLITTVLVQIDSKDDSKAEHSFKAPKISLLSYMLILVFMSKEDGFSFLKQSTHVEQAQQVWCGKVWSRDILKSLRSRATFQ